MKHKSTIAVLGAGGRTGKFVVSELVQQGYPIKALLRKPELFTFQHPLIEIVKGDAIDLDSIRTLISGCDAVISTIGQRKDEPLVALKATQNILQAMKENNVDRYILVAGINVDTPFDKKSAQTLVATDYMKAQFPTIHEDRQRTYALLANYQLAWTLTRVPLIEFTGDRPELKVSLEDCPGMKITAGNIAGFLVRQLTDKNFIRKSPFISND